MILIHNSNSDNTEQDETQNKYKIGLNASAIGEGSSLITVIVRNILNNKTITAVAQSHVIDVPYTSVPTLIKQSNIASSLFLIPPNCGFQIPIMNTHNSLNYEFQLQDPTCDSSQIFVEKNGFVAVKTGEKERSTSVVLKDLQRDYNIHIFPIQVMPVHSIFVEDSFQMFNLQVGGVAQLKVTLQDSYGRSFPENIRGLTI